MKQLLLYLFLLSSVFSQAQSEEITLASDVWPPFTDVEEHKRIAIDIVREALKRVDIDTYFEIEDFEDVISGINKDLYDGSAALWYTEERAKELVFSDPYLHNQLILVARKGTDVSAKSFSDLGEVKFALVANYAYGEEVSKATNLEIIKGKNDQKNLERLLSNKVDYILVDALIIQYMLKFQMNDVSEFLEIGSLPISTQPLHFALNKDVENADSIIEAFNKEIDKMIVDGTYHDLLEVNWIRTDIDGDGKTELVLIGDQAGVDEPENAYTLDPSNQPIESEGFYINGVFYTSWDQVPSNLKVKISDSGNSNYHEGGIILSF